MYDHAILLAVWVHLQVHPNVHLQTRGTYVRTETAICKFDRLMHESSARKCIRLIEADRSTSGDSHSLILR